MIEVHTHGKLFESSLSPGDLKLSPHRDINPSRTDYLILNITCITMTSHICTLSMSLIVAIGKTWLSYM